MAIKTDGFVNLGGEWTSTEGVTGERGTFSIEPGMRFESKKDARSIVGWRGDVYLQLDLGSTQTADTGTTPVAANTNEDGDTITIEDEYGYTVTSAEDSENAIPSKTSDTHLSEGVRVGPAFHLGANRRWTIFPFLEGRLTQNFGRAPVDSYAGVHDQNFEAVGGIGAEIGYQASDAIGLQVGAHTLGGITNAQVDGDGTDTQPGSKTVVNGFWAGASLNLNAVLPGVFGLGPVSPSAVSIVRLTPQDVRSYVTGTGASAKMTTPIMAQFTATGGYKPDTAAHRAQVLNDLNGLLDQIDNLYRPLPGNLKTGNSALGTLIADAKGRLRDAASAGDTKGAKIKIEIGDVWTKDGTIPASGTAADGKMDKIEIDFEDPNSLMLLEILLRKIIGTATTARTSAAATVSHAYSDEEVAKAKGLLGDTKATKRSDQILEADLTDMQLKGFVDDATDATDLTKVILVKKHIPAPVAAATDAAATGATGTAATGATGTAATGTAATGATATAAPAAPVEPNYSYELFAADGTTPIRLTGEGDKPHAFATFTDFLIWVRSNALKEAGAEVRIERSTTAITYKSDVKYASGKSTKADITNTEELNKVVAEIEKNKDLLAGTTIAVQAYASKSGFKGLSAADSHKANMTLANERAASTSELLQEKLAAKGITNIDFAPHKYEAPAEGFKKTKTDYTYAFYNADTKSVISVRKVETTATTTVTTGPTVAGTVDKTKEPTAAQLAATVTTTGEAGKKSVAFKMPAGLETIAITEVRSYYSSKVQTSYTVVNTDVDADRSIGLGFAPKEKTGNTTNTLDVYAFLADGRVIKITVTKFKPSAGSAAGGSSAGAPPGGG